MAIAEDASTPAVATSGAASVTSASFSPPSGSLLVAFYAAEYGPFVADVTDTLSVTDSGGGTWAGGEYQAVYGQFGKLKFAWRFLSSAPGAITVTGSNSDTGTSQSGCLAVRVLTGAAPSQSAAAKAVTHGDSTSREGVITTTAAGSWVYAAAMDGFGSGLSYTPDAATVTITSNTLSGNTLYMGRASAATGTPGDTAAGWTSTQSANWQWLAQEILPAPSGPSAGADTAHAAEPASPVILGFAATARQWVRV